MPPHTFSEMLHELQVDEGIVPIDLVSSWSDLEIQFIRSALHNAWVDGEFEGREILLPSGLTNQSRGTKLWGEFRPLLEGHLQGISFESCRKVGYPDKQLVTALNRSFAFEEKAHTKWDTTDGNRVVICSSTKRLRETFTPPINHIWATLYHTVVNEGSQTICTIHQLSLHFVEPRTIVNRRLEASTSNKLLHQSVENQLHTNISFGVLPE